jgi:F-type H+-transporting ATPase subunit epsilon
MDLIIISPEGTVLQKKTEQVTLPGSKGAFTVLEHHAPLISSLEKGVITYGNGQGKLSIEKGLVEVYNNSVKIFIEDYP